METLENDKMGFKEAKKLMKKQCPNIRLSEKGKDLLAGFVAGFVSVSIFFPLDCIKTRMQTSEAGNKSIYSTGKSIVRSEGIGGLYKGLAPPLLTLSVSSSISLTAFFSFRDSLSAQKGWDGRNYLAGLGVGPIIGLLSTVENHVRTQMQIDNVRERRFRNSFHCLNHIRKHYGLSTIYTGWSITTLKECIFYSSYFFVYEGIKNTLLAPEE